MSPLGMDRFQAVLTLIVGALVAQGSVVRAAPLQQPNTAWVFYRGATACTAALSYGAVKAPVTFALRPSPDGSVFRMVLRRKGRVWLAEHFAVTTSVTDAASRLTGIRFASSDKKGHVVWINLDKAAVARIGAAGEIAINGEGLDERFALPGVAEALATLNTCSDNLRARWNVDEAATASLTRAARSILPLPQYFSSADYPKQPLGAGDSGASRIMMMIDETGVLKDCMVVETSGIASLDAQGCAVLLVRARFSPALDAAGKPTRSVQTYRIRWVN